jgi:hypothetical protein
MRGKHIPRSVLAIQFLMMVILCAADCPAQGVQRLVVLKACTSLFGLPIDDQENLFEVNSLFVLRPQFDKNGTLNSLSVLPKYWFSETHPEWEEPKTWPLLSPAEYRILLDRLDQVSTKGKLTAIGYGSVVTNSTEYFLDRYENAYVHHGNVLSDVRFFEIYPLHDVQGYVRRKRHYRSLFHEDFYQILVGESNYFVHPKTYIKVKRGERQKILVVGPIRGYCYAGFCNTSQQHDNQVRRMRNPPTPWPLSSGPFAYSESYLFRPSERN